MHREILLALCKDDLVALILAQHAQIEALTTRITDLETRLGAPPKTPDNSSLPPSKGQKPNLPDRPKKSRPGRPGIARALAERPDRIIEATLATCLHCTHALVPADQPDIHACDHIDLPPFSPVVTRINRYRGVCPCWHKHVAALVPEGFEPGSPFGPGLCALIIHLHVIQAIGFQRLARPMAEVFGVTISEGAIATILARAEAPLLAAAAPIAAAVRASPVVGSDETSARVGGRRQDRVAMGAAEFGGDPPRDRRYAGGVRGDRVHGRRAAGGVGGRPLRRSGWSWRGPTDVPGASAARHDGCDRGRLCGVRAWVPTAAVAGGGDWQATRPAGGQHPGT